MKKFFISEYNELEDLSDYEMTPKQAIIAKCKQCSCFNMQKAILCNVKNCALHNLLVRYTKTSRTRKKMFHFRSVKENVSYNANNQETDFDD